MPHNIVFVVSHLGSGSSGLVTILNENPRIDISNKNLSYEHPSVLEYLFSLGHKLDNTAAIYGDQILFNKDLGCRAFYDFSKFIYVIRPPKFTLNELVYQRNEYDESTAENYYAFRLRRMYEMARDTPGAVFLTWDDLRQGRGLNLIEEYLNLKTPLVSLPELFQDLTTSKVVAADVLKRTEDCYEKYLYYFRNLNLQQVNPIKSSVVPL